LCFDNVLSQDCKDIEHIIIDAASTDGTVKIIQNYADRHSHIRWLSEPDTGQSDAINKGIKLAKSNIIGILNVDDFYEAETLSFIQTRLKRCSTPVFLTGKCRVVDSLGRVKGISDPKDLSLTNLLARRCEYPCNPSAYFYEKSLHEVVGYYDTKDHHSMDLDFICRVLSVCSITYVDRILGNFREVEGTKTYRSKQSGAHFDRKHKVLSRYRRRLSMVGQFQILMIRVFGLLHRTISSSRRK